MSVPIFINCRDRLEPLLALLNYLERAGQNQIYLLDNDSAYPPLLDYFSRTSHRVIQLGRNVGRHSPWDADVLVEQNVRGRFVFSDPDIVPDPDCPMDAIEFFSEILDAFPEREKVGFGLRIDDLPDTYKFKEAAVVWESQFWERPLAPRLYDAPIATTFALYRGPSPHRHEPSIRTGYPYVARHTPWYVDDTSLSADEMFYRRRAEGDHVNHWSREELPAWLAHEVQSRNGRTRREGGVALGVERVVDPPGITTVKTSQWLEEPEPADETKYTPWAESGWHSWNGMSPEVEVCEFIAMLVRTLGPTNVVETGVGQGFVTRRIAAHLRDDALLIGFESDASWRAGIASVPLFDGSRCSLSEDETPSDEQLGRAELCVLDSELPHRLSEIGRWWTCAHVGAVIFVHDTGNGHGAETSHALIRARVTALCIPGFFLSTPRGAFVGVKPWQDPSDADAAALQTEIDALRATRTFRYSAPFRRLYRALRLRFP